MQHLQLWHLIVTIAGLVILPNIPRLIGMYFKIGKNQDALVLESSQRKAEDRAIREHCRESHRRVDEHLLDLKTTQAKQGELLTCIDKKMAKVLAVVNGEKL